MMKSRCLPFTINFPMKNMFRDLCKKALLPTTETSTQFFVYFRP